MMLPSGDLNLNPYPPHLTNIYTCVVTTVPRVRSGESTINKGKC